MNKVEVINGVEYPRMSWSEMKLKYKNRRVFLANIDNSYEDPLVTIIIDCSDEEYENVLMSLPDIGVVIYPYRTDEGGALLWV